VHPSVSVDSVKSLIAYAKARPRQVIYASAGSGTTTHLGGAMFSQHGGRGLTHVPLQRQRRSAGRSARRTDAAHVSPRSPTSLPHINPDGCAPIAVTRLNDRRRLPDLPTVHEAGLRGFDISLWQAIVAPAGLRRASSS
jgi:tripartite-type tricarboxylate transporter receptor subunit TctC